MKTILGEDGLRHVVCKLEVFASITACGLSMGGLHAFDGAGSATCFSCISAANDDREQQKNLIQRAYTEAVERRIKEGEAPLQVYSQNMGVLIHEGIELLLNKDKP